MEETVFKNKTVSNTHIFKQCHHKTHTTYADLEKMLGALLKKTKYEVKLTQSTQQLRH